MSYSYIKSVFPNFENSNKVYDENLYNNITNIYSTTELPQPENDEKIKLNYKISQNNIFDTQEQKVEKMTNVTNDYAEFTLQKQPQSQNNLSYYNIPLEYKRDTSSSNDIIGKNKDSLQTRNVKTHRTIETFENKECDIYIKHVYECDYCKKIVMKQLGVDNDKYRHEEMMEVASYIIFGLFILLLVDSLKSEKR
jgi:hypothetical protein